VELIAQRRPKDEMEPYERLLLDAARGASEFFAREDQVEQAWRIVGPILGNAVPVRPYAPGTWGPKEADKLIIGEGTWWNPRPEKDEKEGVA
jgi:glucose-6-phosphate 1-dehydrogenase